MATFEETGQEYRVAYEQLKHLKAQHKAIREQLDRDYDLTWKRYESAQRSYLELALGEDDAFLSLQED